MNTIANEKKAPVAAPTGARPLARLMAREVSAEEITAVAGGAGTGSIWPYTLQPADTDVQL